MSGVYIEPLLQPLRWCAVEYMYVYQYHVVLVVWGGGGANTVHI